MKILLLRSFRTFPVLCLGVLLCGALLAAPIVAHTERTATVKSGMTLKGKIIAIDAGHGGADPGAVGVTGTVEKDINLLLVKELSALLKEKGAVPILTRTDDSVYSNVKREDLDHRAAIVKKADAELFLSLQCNATPNSELHGAQTFYYPESEQGQLLAEAVQNRFRNMLGNTDREALTLSSAYIMSTLDIPAVMVEVGFLSNPEEEKLLNDEAYRKKIVTAVYCGILDYYKTRTAAPSWLRDIIEMW